MFTFSYLHNKFTSAVNIEFFESKLMDLINNYLQNIYA